MVKDINISECIEDNNSWYNYKPFKIGSVDFKGTVKTLDSKNLSKNVFDSIIGKYKFKFCELTKNIDTFDRLYKLYTTDSDEFRNNFFNSKRWLKEIPNVINFTFNFNPYDHVDNTDKISWFFDQYYEFSSLFLTIPNIRTKKKIKVESPIINTNNTIQTMKEHTPIYRLTNLIDIRQYMEFVDDCFQLLSSKNNKPIFVPLSLRLSFKELDTLIEHYINKEYYNYWFDFEGKSINPNTLSRIRRIFNIIKNKGYFPKTISFFTNIKREIISNVKLNESPASDILSSIAGANIIGVNREPPRPLSNLVPQSPPEHKARIFESKNYYYVKTNDSKLYQKNRYVTYNSVILDKELSNQTENFFKEYKIYDYLKDKNMLKEYENGKMLTELMFKSESSPINEEFY